MGELRWVANEAAATTRLDTGQPFPEVRKRSCRVAANRFCAPRRSGSGLSRAARKTARAKRTREAHRRSFFPLDSICIRFENAISRNSAPTDLAAGVPMLDSREFRETTLFGNLVTVKSSSASCNFLVAFVSSVSLRLICVFCVCVFFFAGWNDGKFDNLVF